MIYVTVKQTPNGIARRRQVTIEDLLRDINYAPPETPEIANLKEYPKYFTFQLNPEDREYRNLLRNYPLDRMATNLRELADDGRHLLLEDMSEHYDTFHIPKHSGGMRRIDAPKPALMDYLTHAKNLLQNDLYVLPHNAAHAYTSKRSIITAMQLHQCNESKWFLKLDLKDFFPNHNHDYIMGVLAQLFPFAELVHHEPTREALSTIIRLGLLDDKLPQGTPLSPILTNILMIPIDCSITKMLKDIPHQHFVYTRYADDLTISSKYHFAWQQIQTTISGILTEHQTPFTLKTEKTRYGSSAGRNWNLGIMLNKDNRLTIGHKQNQRFRAAVFSFLSDLTNGNPWDRMDIQVLLGQISYYESVEPEYVQSVLHKYSDKFGIDFKAAAKQAMTT